MANEAILSFENLGKQFGLHWAIRKASAQLKPNDYLALVGPNGAGKTTLLRLLCKVYRPNEGHVNFSKLFFGNAYYFSTNAMFYAPLTAFENLRFYLQLFSRPQQDLEALLEYCGLTGQGERKIENFSTGMLQRLNVAALLAVKPRYVFFDEPFNGLDTEGQQLVRQLLANRGNQDWQVALEAFLVVDHNLTRVAKLTQGHWLVESGGLTKTSSENKTLLKKAQAHE